MMLGAKTRTLSKRASVLFVASFIILLLLGTTAGVMHIHTDGAGHTDCALCQSAHSIARPSAAPRIQPVVFVAIRIAPVSTCEYREHLFSYSHWNRPPPAQIAIA